MKDLQCLIVKCPRLINSQFKEIHESLALAYICSTLRKIGFQTEILDAFILDLSINETVDKISRNKYDLIGFTIPDPTFIEPTILCIKKIRREGSTAHITMGGFTPTFHYKEIFNMCLGIDSIVMYEGEGTISELAKLLEANREWKEIDGIAFKSERRVKANKPRPLIKELDSIPFAARDTLPLVVQKFQDSVIVSILGSRGCHKSCNFCAVSRFYSIPEGHPLRFRSSKNIVDEIESIVNFYDIKEFLFADDIFIGPGNKNKERIFHFADELENRKVKVLFSIADRVDNVDQEILRRLKDVGLRQMFIGLESGNQDMINQFNKDITIKQIEDAVKLLKDLDIDFEASFINFTPDNTLEDIEQNIDFFLNLDINTLQGLLNRVQLYGGTQLYEQLSKDSRLEGKFPKLSYRNNKDPRVDFLYSIVKDCLGHFLVVSYKTKEIKRLIRRKLFQAQFKKDDYKLKKLQILNTKFQHLQKTITFEASNVFKEAINFVKISHKKPKQNVEGFKKVFLKDSVLESQDWLNMLVLYERFCLNYDLKEYNT